MRFVAPINFKQGRLIMNQYRVSDLILLAVCTAFSFIFTIIYLTNVGKADLRIIVLILMPGMIAYLLTMPCGIYHNNLFFLITLIHFYRSKKEYIWEGVYKDDCIQTEDDTLR